MLRRVLMMLNGKSSSNIMKKWKLIGNHKAHKRIRHLKICGFASLDKILTEVMESQYVSHLMISKFDLTDVKGIETVN